MSSLKSLLDGSGKFGGRVGSQPSASVCPIETWAFPHNLMDCVFGGLFSFSLSWYFVPLQDAALLGLVGLQPHHQRYLKISDLFLLLSLF